MIGGEPCAIDRINRLTQVMVDITAGLDTRRYKVVKSDRAEDLVFQSGQDWVERCMTTNSFAAYQTRRRFETGGAVSLPLYRVLEG